MISVLTENRQQMDNSLSYFSTKERAAHHRFDEGVLYSLVHSSFYFHCSQLKLLSISVVSKRETSFSWPFTVTRWIGKMEDKY